jgi:hypothetical protein
MNVAACWHSDYALMSRKTLSNLQRKMSSLRIYPDESECMEWTRGQHGTSRWCTRRGEVKIDRKLKRRDGHDPRVNLHPRGTIGRRSRASPDPSFRHSSVAFFPGPWEIALATTCFWGVRALCSVPSPPEKGIKAAEKKPGLAFCWNCLTPELPWRWGRWFDRRGLRSEG